MPRKYTWMLGFLICGTTAWAGTYSALPLGYLDPVPDYYGPFTEGTSISSNGKYVTGIGADDNSQANSHIAAFLWSAATGITNLGPAAPAQGVGFSVNDSGLVAGYICQTCSGDAHAAFFSNGSIIDLNGANPNSIANGINNSGQITGAVNGFYGFRYDTATSSGVCLGSLNGVAPTTFTGATIPACPGFSVPFAINNSGQITGWSDSFSGPGHVFLFSGGVMTDIGAGDGSRAFAISDNGNITGQLPDNAFAYINGVFTDIGNLPGFLDSRGTGINSRGQIVGLSWSPPDYNDTVAWLYQNGTFYALNDLMLPGFDFFLYEAMAINDSGQIVANGCDADFNCESFLLTDVPEPEPFPIYSFGLALIVLWRGLKARAHVRWLSLKAPGGSPRTARRAGR